MYITDEIREQGNFESIYTVAHCQPENRFATRGKQTDGFTCRQTDGKDRQIDRQASEHRQAGRQAGKQAGRPRQTELGRANQVSVYYFQPTNYASAPPSRYYVSDIPKSFPEYLTRNRLNVCYSNRVEIHLIAPEDQELSRPSPTCSIFAISFFPPVSSLCQRRPYARNQTEDELAESLSAKDAGASTKFDCTYVKGNAIERGQLKCYAEYATNF